jgi:serine/threonine protein phosphatase 1
MHYFAISDIHGYLDVLKDTMKIVDLESNHENKLIFLGDYIDYGNQSSETLYYIKELSEKLKNQIVVLKGNHEEMFLNWLFNPIDNVYYLIEDQDLKTIKTFLAEEQYLSVCKKMKDKENILSTSKLIATMVKNNHTELILWLRKLKYYYQTDKQIFVHAGIDEDAQDLWMHGTSKDYFINKYPAQTGIFYKDIIAGHIGTSEFRKDKKCYEVYWDEKSHYYIDGTVQESGVILILKYDTKTGIYTSFRKMDNGTWEEYNII